MRPLDRIVSALSAVVSAPAVERGYEELASAYAGAGMEEDAEAVRLLILGKFSAHDPSGDEEQR